jgi:hypothetical protein
VFKTANTKKEGRRKHYQADGEIFVNSTTFIAVLKLDLFARRIKRVAFGTLCQGVLAHPILWRFYRSLFSSRPPSLRAPL